MSDLINYIRPELLIVALVLYFIGMLLKKINKLKDNFIPIILGSLGVIACVVYLGIVDGWTLAVIVSGCVQGVLCAACSTYVNQIIKQMQKLGVNKTVADVAEVVVKNEDEKKEEDK